MNINYSNILKLLIPFIVLVLIAYFINSVLYLFLPKNYSQKAKEIEENLEYKKYYISNSFSERNRQKGQNSSLEKKEYQLISNINLKAIYATNNKLKGWIILSENASQKTTLLSVGDKFKKYLLKEVYPNYVIFEKNSQEFKLLLEKKDKTKAIFESKNNITYDDGKYILDRKFVNNYTSDNTKLFRGINIKEIKTEKGIDGFEINSLSYNSVFSKLGLQKGDIIKAVNNINLKSYNDAFKIYKQLNNLESLRISIIRNNTTMELEYEIK